MSTLDKMVAASLPLVPKPVVRRVAAPYIAGEGEEDLLRVAADMNRDGFAVAAAILGEFVNNRAEADEAVEEYRVLLRALHEHHIDSYVHVKPTHLGLKLDRELCTQNVRALLDCARPLGMFVRMDMEDSPCIDDTLAIYYELQKEYDNLGVVIQARMRRSLADVRELVRVKANVRLCKGIYLEPYALSYTDPYIINRNFTLLLEELLAGGGYTAIATHDDKLVWEADRLLDRLGVPADRYEFQMLLGVRAPLRTLIRDAGHRLRVAVPYGPSWYAYSLRRLRKNPAIAGYVLKSMFKG